MSDGILDWPAPLFDLVDAPFIALGAPPFVRVAFWGIVAGVASMAIYRVTSPQQRLQAIRDEIVAVRAAVLAHEGEFAAMQGLVTRQLSLAFRQLGLTLGPALVGTLPIFVLLPWLSNLHARVAPAVDAPTTVCVEPASAAASLRWTEGAAAAETPACWRVRWPAADAPNALVDARGEVVLTLPTAVPTTIVHRRAAFNALIGNPAGYLPDDAAVDAVRIDAPARDFIPRGPGWLRGFEAVFFIAMFAAAWWLRRRWRLT